MQFSSSHDYSGSSAFNAPNMDEISEPEYVERSDGIGMGNELCEICNDKATGKHYGVNSCDGCKGFFRRSVREGSDMRYQCSNREQCDIKSKKSRNKCKYCRFRRCVQAGMRKDLVQDKRDKQLCRSDEDKDSPITLHALQLAEQKAQPKSELEATPKIPDVPDANSNIRDSLILQLERYVKFATKLPCFTMLTLEDKQQLLRTHVREQLVLGVAYRTYNEDRRCGLNHTAQRLVLANSTILPRDSWDEAIRNVTKQILDVIVYKMHKFDFTQDDYLFMKAILLFDPHTRNIIARNQIESIRDSLIAQWGRRSEGAASKYIQLALMIPDIQEIALHMSQHILEKTRMGEILSDELINDVLLTELPQTDRADVHSPLGPNLPSFGHPDSRRSPAVFPPAPADPLTRNVPINGGTLSPLYARSAPLLGLSPSATPCAATYSSPDLLPPDAAELSSASLVSFTHLTHSPPSASYYTGVALPLQRAVPSILVKGEQLLVDSCDSNNNRVVDGAAHNNIAPEQRLSIGRFRQIPLTAQIKAEKQLAPLAGLPVANGSLGMYQPQHVFGGAPTQNQLSQAAAMHRPIVSSPYASIDHAWGSPSTAVPHSEHASAQMGLISSTANLLHNSMH